MDIILSALVVSATIFLLMLCILMLALSVKSPHRAHTRADLRKIKEQIEHPEE